MSPAHIVVLVCLCLEGFAVVLRTGKPRPAYTPGQTAFDVAYWAWLAVLLVLG